jgi:hypothetical protein
MTAAQQTIRSQDAHNTVPSGLHNPNFAKICAFLGSLFDPNVNNHLDTLNEMSPIDRETIQLLMHNLSVNLANQQFREQHAFLLDQYRLIIQKQSEQVCGNTLCFT